jgi:hypothetical protein
MGDFKIVTYSTKYESMHFKFASKYWKKKRRLDSNYIKWKFRLNDKKNKTFLLAIGNNKVVGQLGLVLCEYKYKNVIYSGQWCCDLMVDIDYRGKGVANMLYEYAHELKDVSFGSDPSTAAFNSMSKIGYSQINSSWKILFPITIGEIFKLKSINNDLLDSIINPFVYIFKFFTKKKYNEISKEEFLNNSIKRISDGLYYNDSFLDWRLNKFKGFYPKVLFFKDIENSFAGYYSGRTFYIVNYDLNSTLDYIRVVSFIINKYNHENILRVRFFCSNDKISNSLRFFGFIKFRTPTRIIFFTKHLKLKNMLLRERFNYSYLDSDECI